MNRLFPTNPVNRRYRCLDVDLSRSASVEQPAGACLAVKRSAFERCGGFDEHFAPLWFEDVDLCKRLREAGGEIVYCPEVVVRHAGGHSVALLSPPEKQVYWYRNLLYYVHKHFRWCTGLIIRSALLFGAGMRMAAEVAGMFVSRDTPRGVRADRVRSYWRAAELSFLEWPRR